MQLREFYNLFLTELKPLYGYGETSAVSAMIFEHFVGKSKGDIIIDPHHIIEKEKVSLLENALLQLKRQVPVQYVIGHAWFAGLKFKVSPAVLIPRPETEELVKEVVSYIKTNGNSSLLDIGTGSGCIPITVKKEFPETNVSAIDISGDALSVARENALANNVTIQWLQQDFLEAHHWERLSQYDVIVSNPPYIPENEKELLDANVTAHEPHIALFVSDKRALIFYEKIAAFGAEHLAKNGCIFMETHEFFANEVGLYFSGAGYKTVIKKDIFGKERMVMASLSR
ncbi:MAG: peptide chain release factor N(5)-glutamine methyltransferase [Rhizobacter sp.]|nr:peptide chain release factor N(5)-glutamine methyltransferase [Ferruginibacter sp.]